jgi:hypothetical protein
MGCSVGQVIYDTGVHWRLVFGHVHRSLQLTARSAVTKECFFSLVFPIFDNSPTDLFPTTNLFH